MRKWLLKNLVCYRVCCPSSQPLVDEEDEEDYDGSLQDALASNPHMRNTFSEPDFYYDTDTKSLDVTLVTQHNILHTPSPTNGKGILVKNINGKRPQSNKKTSNEFLNVLDGERYVRFGE